MSVHDDGRLARLEVGLEDGSLRHAIAYPALTGPLQPGDDVIVNIEAQDLGLGSGGVDIVSVGLQHGLGGQASREEHVMKLNYTPIQHAVRPLEEGLEQLPEAVAMPVAVLALHGQLACAAFAFSSRAPAARVGYVQTAGGALPGALSDVAADLLERGLIADHVTVAPCFGAPQEAITLEGALHAGSERLGWDAALIGPGPGILGSASALGHGGLAALHSAHSALALGCEVILAPRLSSGDERPRHRALSHHTRTVLGLLLQPVQVAVPDAISAESRKALDQALAGEPGHSAIETSVEDLVRAYRASGLPAETMGRTFERDQDFFTAGLAAGAALAAKIEARS